MKRRAINETGFRSIRPARYILLFAFLMLIGFGILVAPFAQPPLDAFTQTIVKCSAGLIRFLGGSVKAQGVIMTEPVHGFAVELQNGCNGVEVMIVLWAAILAFPAPWMSRIKGCLLGAVAIQVANFARFISLFYIGQYSLPLFEFTHVFLWQSLIMLDAMVVFWLWVRGGFQNAVARHA